MQFGRVESLHGLSLLEQERIAHLEDRSNSHASLKSQDLPLANHCTTPKSPAIRRAEKTSDTTSMTETVIIVGASHAGAQAIDSLRRDGFKGRIVLIGDEPYLPYQRPPLSKKYLLGELPLERLAIRAPTFYEQHQVDVRLGNRVTAIDCAHKRVRLA